MSFPPTPEATDGEASNPGPPTQSKQRASIKDLSSATTWAALNCTALRSQLHQVLKLQSDFGLGLTGRQNLACRLQYTLLDILEARSKLLPQAPQPRWQRNVERRIN